MIILCKKHLTRKEMFKKYYALLALGAILAAGKPISSMEHDVMNDDVDISVLGDEYDTVNAWKIRESQTKGLQIVLAHQKAALARENQEPQYTEVGDSKLTTYAPLTRSSLETLKSCVSLFKRLWPASQAYVLNKKFKHWAISPTFGAGGWNDYVGECRPQRTFWGYIKTTEMFESPESEEEFIEHLKKEWGADNPPVVRYQLATSFKKLWRNIKSRFAEKQMQSQSPSVREKWMKK